MRKIILSILLLGFCKIASADIYVVHEKVGKQIVFITEEENYVINDAGLEVKVLPNNLAFYNLTNAHSDYLLAGTNIILNTAKITAREDAKNAAIVAEAKRVAERQTAKNKLVTLGLTPEEFEAIAR